MLNRFWQGCDRMSGIGGDEGRSRLSVGPESTDEELLAAFLADRSEAAFETIVTRHGPLVLQTARRMLGQVSDAEDVFQAAFLILSQKAGTVRPQSQLANWLYGVTTKLALKARRTAARRAENERRAPAMSESTTPPSDDSDLVRVIDEEIQQLHPKYRVPVVLC